MSEAVLNHSHELLNDSEHSTLVDTGCLSDFANYICFSHKFCIVLNLIYIPNTKLQKFMVIIINHAVDTFDMSIKNLCHHIR